jgi:hypothetical protein
VRMDNAQREAVLMRNTPSNDHASYVLKLKVHHPASWRINQSVVYGRRTSSLATYVLCLRKTWFDQDALHDSGRTRSSLLSFHRDCCPVRPQMSSEVRPDIKRSVRATETGCLQVVRDRGTTSPRYRFCPKEWRLLCAEFTTSLLRSHDLDSEHRSDLDEHGVASGVYNPPPIFDCRAHKELPTVLAYHFGST